MSLYVILKALHILSMFAVIGIYAGSEWVMDRLLVRGDVPALRGFLNAYRPLVNAVPVIFIAGIVLGFATALVGGLDLLEPWLVIAYVLLIVDLALNVFLGLPWLSRLEAGVEASGDGPPSPELVAVRDDPAGRLVYFGSTAILALIIVDMVVKPFS